MAETTVTLRIVVEGNAALRVVQGFIAEQKRMGAAIKEAGQAAAAGGQQITQSFHVAGRAAVDLRGEMDLAKKAVLTWGAAITGVMQARAFVGGIVQANNALQGWRTQSEGSIF